MPVTAAVIGIGAAVGTGAAGVYAAHKQSQSTDKATLAQQQSNQEALDFLKQKQQQYEDQIAPYRTLGTQGLAQLQNLLGLTSGQNPTTAPPKITTQSSDPTLSTMTTAPPPNSNTPAITGPGMDPRLATLRNTPGYQFQYQQGLDATNSSPFLTRLTGGKGVLGGLQDYGHGLADQSYEEYINNYLNLAKLGVPPPPA
jgi:hypothetical protein